MGVAQNTLGRYERGERTPDAEFLLVLRTKLGVSAEWLLTGEGPMTASAGNPVLPHNKAPRPVQRDGLCALPHTGNAESFWIPLESDEPSAGTGMDILDEEPRCYYPFPVTWLRKFGKPEDMRLMKVSGHSMEPEIRNGDMVMLDRGKTRPLTGRFFVVRLEGSLYIKRVEVLPRKLRLVSLDTSYTPIEVDMSQDYTDLVQIVGQVLWLGRELL